MRIEVLGSYGGESLECRMTCLLINGTVALDAGSLSQALPIERQVGVHSILLSHSHMDHTSALPFFIENVYGNSSGAIDIYASSATIYAIRKYLFNNATWPDFTRLPNHLLPAVKFHEIQSEVPLEIDGVRFTPIEVDHLVPTHGFLIEHGGAAVLWSSDTGPTRRLWEIANRTRNLAGDLHRHQLRQRAPGDRRRLAPPDAPHPLARAREAGAGRADPAPSPQAAVRREDPRRGVRQLGNPNIGFLEQGRVYEF